LRNLATLAPVGVPQGESPQRLECEVTWKSSRLLG